MSSQFGGRRVLPRGGDECRRHRELAAGEFLFRQAEPGTSLAVVLDGTASAVGAMRSGTIVGAVIASVRMSSSALATAVTVAGGIFATLKTFVIVGLVAVAVFIAVWLVARRPHRG